MNTYKYCPKKDFDEKLHSLYDISSLLEIPKKTVLKEIYELF